MKLQITFLYLLSFSLASCNFNKLLVQPDKIPADKKKVYETVTKTYKDGSISHDTTKVIQIGNNFQPTITDTKGNITDLNYTIESVVFKGSQGNELNGWMIKAKNTTPKVTLLFLHGGGGNIITHYPTVIPLVEKGFQVFIPDYSGFGFSRGKATRKNVLKDGIAALKYLHDRTDVQSTHIIVYGQSMGAHFAPGVAASNQDLTDGLVMEGGFPYYKKLAAHFIVFGFAARILVKEDFNVPKALKEYRKPVLVIHSNEDEMVPLSMGRKLFNEANDPKSYFEIGKCHMCGPVFYSDKISEKINAMIQK